MKLNLGCGTDVREGYTNVDWNRGLSEVVNVDLSKLPWPFPDAIADEILMIDFLEHFEHGKTMQILGEVWRVLKHDAEVVVQVPDLEHCAMAATMIRPFMCNMCGWTFPESDTRANFFMCGKCGRTWSAIAEDAIKRLYGGQDYEGNYHKTGFTKLRLDRMLQEAGFDRIEDVERNDNGETHFQNWNFMFRARKGELW